MKNSGVSFDEELIPLDTEEFEERIQRYSPTRRVPVLHDHGQVVWDSLADGAGRRLECDAREHVIGHEPW